MNRADINIALIVSITVSSVALIIAADSFPISFDTFWHLATGRDFILYGDSPFRDHYSFTYFGNDISSNAIVFQVIIASYVQVFGLEYGYFLFKLTIYSLLALLTYYFYKTNNVHSIAILLTLPFLTYFFLTRGMNVRPEIIGYAFFMLFLILYLRTLNNFNSTNLFIICILLVAWSNYHTAIFGYIFVSGLLLEKFIFKLEGKESFSWPFFLFWCFAIFVTGFVNKELHHVVFSQIGLSSEWKLLISEYNPILDFYHPAFVTLFFGFCAYLIYWLLKTRQYGMLLVSVLLISQTWFTVRLISFSGVLVSCLYALLLNEHFRSSAVLERIISLSKKRRRHVFIALGFIVILSHLLLIYRSYKVFSSDPEMDAYFPRETTAYLVKHYRAGNVFNRYTNGGYLTYSLPRDFKIYIDGRSNILYPLDFFKRSLRIIHYPSILAEDVKKYHIDFAILENHRFNYELLYKTGLFTIDFVDKYFFLAKRSAGNFPVSGAILMKPSCWDARISDQLLSESDAGKRILSVSSPLREIQTYLQQYAATNDKKQFFQEIVDDSPESVFTKRVLGHLAFEDEYFNESALLFGTIRSRISTDIMMMAAALMQQHRYSDAFQLLSTNFYPIGIKTRLTSSERETLLRIIKYLSTKTEVKLKKSLLPEFNKVLPITSDLLRSELCNTRILPVIEDHQLAKPANPLRESN